MPPLLRHRRATVAVAALFAGAPPVATAVTVGGPVTDAVGRDSGVVRGGLLGAASNDLLLRRGPVALASQPIRLVTAGSAMQVEMVPPIGPTAGVDPWAPSVARPGAAEGSALPSARSAGPAQEPAGSVEPARNGGSTGLLALIATVCVVGVSAGAIRAIIAQRATRTRVA